MSKVSKNKARNCQDEALGSRRAKIREDEG
jgi:hypothetical protein